MKKRRNPVLFLWTVCMMMSAFPASAAMVAPGGGAPDWHYDQESYEWSYRKNGEEPYTGWLNFDGEWYWFDPEGVMQSGGETKIEGNTYYFFVNGNMAWNQYVGMKFYDSEGQYDELYDVHVYGDRTPDSEEKDILSDYLYLIPRSWQHSFTRSGWQMMFYTDKEYFAAPKQGDQVYYIHHRTDTLNKKVKFTDVDAALQGWGEYIGHAAGCYKNENAWMKQIQKDLPKLQSVLQIPENYKNNKSFCFGKVFAAYLEEESYLEMAKKAPDTCRAIEEILCMKEDAKTRKQYLKRAEERRGEALAQALRATSHKYGPGVKKDNKK